MKNFYRIPVRLPRPESRDKRVAQHAASGRPRLPAELKEDGSRRPRDPKPFVLYAATKAEAIEKLTERLRADHAEKVSECEVMQGHIQEASYENGKSQFAKGGPIYQSLSRDDIAEVWQDLMNREAAKPDIVSRPPMSPDCVVFSEWMTLHNHDEFVRITKERSEVQA